MGASGGMRMEALEKPILLPTGGSELSLQVAEGLLCHQGPSTQD